MHLPLTALTQLALRVEASIKKANHGIQMEKAAPIKLKSTHVSQTMTWEINNKKAKLDIWKHVWHKSGSTSLVSHIPKHRMDKLHCSGRDGQGHSICKFSGGVPNLRKTSIMRIAGLGPLITWPRVVASGLSSEGESGHGGDVFQITQVQNRRRCQPGKQGTSH